MEYRIRASMVVLNWFSFLTGLSSEEAHPSACPIGLDVSTTHSSESQHIIEAIEKSWAAVKTSFCNVTAEKKWTNLGSQ